MSCTCETPVIVTETRHGWDKYSEFKGQKFCENCGMVIANHPKGTKPQLSKKQRLEKKIKSLEEAIRSKLQRARNSKTLSENHKPEEKYHRYHSVYADWRFAEVRRLTTQLEKLKEELRNLPL